MQNIYPCLWFDNQAEEAAKFYTSIFPNSKITNITYYTEAGPAPAGTVLTVNFTLNGQDCLALNGGPTYAFTPAISMVVNCKTQEEVDKYWGKLTEEGTEVQCGWVTDKYGLSWQIFPEVMGEMLQDKDKKKVQRVMEAMMKMVKLDIAALKEAFENEKAAV
jgi:predicted 3-demethylubiquinone-9 3-methyltransferase (glyoxalase superfamily)